MSKIDNLVSYWKLDESSGNAVDSVGSNTGVNTNVTYSTGKINNGGVFNGSAYIIIPNEAKGGNSVTFSCWVKVSSLASNIVLYSESGSANMGLAILSTGALQLNNDTSSTSYATYDSATGLISINTWYHIAYVYNSTTGYLKGYINGSEVISQSRGGNQSYLSETNSNSIGAYTYNNGTQHSANFNGIIDEVGIWSRALTSTEITTLYNSGSGTQYPFTVVLTTQAVTNIDLTSATLNGTLVSDAGFTVIEKGFVYSTSENPTVDDIKVVVAGASLGAYTSSATGLTANTIYYVRSYATNSIGTGYGDQVSFTTLSLGAKKLYLDINGIEGETYTVSLNVGGSAGSVSVKLGSTSTAHVINAGAGVTVFSDVYSGLSGLIIESSEGFVGTVDDVFYVLTLGDAVIDWALNSLTNVIAVNSSVTFKRIEDKEITRFNLYRYLDVLFKDLDGYVTVTLVEEKNDLSYSKSKQFLVGNTGTTVSPFVKKRISMLSKNQAILISFSNNKLNETFTVCQYSLTGYREPRKLYKLSKIISI